MDEAETSWTDEPLESAVDDRLGRGAYARQAAALISSVHSFDSSAVVGLSGAWGSGKTTLVNMIVEALQKDHPEWVVARFTPWATSDVTGLLSEFYSSLARALPQKKTRHLKAALALTASVAAPATALIPYGGGSAAAALKALGEAMTKAPSWEAAFHDASEQLKKLGIPILIVVDDIDRLQSDELMALLRVVRLLGRFDGVEYLLAYDDETVFRTLSSAHAVEGREGTAERFMEKIVQYPLLVPPLLRHQQLNRLNDGLKRVSRSDVKEDGRLSSMLDAFVTLLRTPRAIDRYVAQLQHHLPLVPHDEIDDGDVLLLTLIRVSFPAMFNALPLSRNELINGHTGEMILGSRELRYHPFDPAPLLELAPERHRKLAGELLQALFPKLRAEHSLAPFTFYNASRLGVANEDYFDRYFAMAIPAHDISDATVRAAVARAVSGDGEQLHALLEGTDEDRLNLVLSKGALADIQPATDVSRLLLVYQLTLAATNLPGDDTTPFSPQDQVLTWIGDLVANLTPAATPDAVIGALDDLTEPSMRIRAWRSIEHKVEKMPPGDRPPWFAGAADALATEAVEQVLSHLEQADRAPTDSRVGYLLQFALRSGRLQELRTKIAELIETGRIDRSVFASRLVSAISPSGGRGEWRLSDDFNQETYDLLAPGGDDPLYTAPIVEVDECDLSWANRRLFVQGRVKPPPESSTDD